MKKGLKWGLIIVGGLVVVIILALLLIPMFVDVGKYKPMLEKEVAKATGRPFSVGDDLSLSLFPWAGISFSDLRLGNPPGFSEKDFLTLKSFEVRVKLIPLLFKNIQVQRFVLIQPKVELVKNKDGRANWTQPAKPGEKEKEPPAETSGLELPFKTLTIGDFAVKDGTVIYTDHASGTSKRVSDLNLTLRDVSFERPMQLALSARLDQKPISLDGRVGPLGKPLGEGAIPLDLSLKAVDELNLEIRGRVMNPTKNPAVDVALNVAEFSPRKLVSALGQAFPVTTADPKALSRVGLVASIKADAASVAISGGKLDLDDSKMTFSLKASEFSKPDVAFDIKLDQINLDRYLPPEAEKKPGEEKPAPEPAPAKKPMDYEPLRRLVVDGQLKVGKLVAHHAKLEEIILKVTGKNGVFNLDPLSMALYQGTFAGKANLNVQGKTPKTGVNLGVSNVQVGPLLRDVMKKDFLEGVTNARINLTMVGDQPEQIKKTLNGEGELKFNDGAIKGFDLASMARNVKSAFGLEAGTAEKPRTDFAELIVPFTMTGGVFKTPLASVKSPLFRLEAAGKADLVQEVLDFRVEPKVVATIKGQGDEKEHSGIMVPVLITGNFASPKFRPDLKSVVTEQLDKKILESDKAKKLLEDEKMKPLEGPAKELLKGLFKNK